MTFENLDSNFDKVAAGDFKKGDSPEMDHHNKKTTAKTEEEKYESKFNKDNLGGLLQAFQEKLKKSRAATTEDTASDSFDTITITSDDIIKTSNVGNGAEVSEDDISKLLSKNPPQNTEQTTEDTPPIKNPISENIKEDEQTPSEDQDESKSPITDSVTESENIVIVNADSKGNEPSAGSIGEVFQTVKVVPRRYEDDHPVTDKRAHLADGFSQQAIHRASQGESPSGMPHNDKEVDGDYIAEHLRIHREKKAAEKAKAQATGQQQGKVSETIISTSGEHEDGPSETILTDSDIVPE